MVVKCFAVLVAAASLCVSACVIPPTTLLDANPERGGALGDSGAYGAGLWERRMRVRGDDVVDVDVVVPLVDEGVVADGAFAPVLFVQGGLVDVARYRWLLAHVASRGFIAIAPRHALDLAFFSQGNNIDVLTRVRALSNTNGDALEGRVADVGAAVIGHSLGGVVGAKTWLAGGDDVTHLGLLASIPDPSDDNSARTSGKVLSLAGDSDGRIGVDAIGDGAKDFAVPTVVAEVSGMTHFAWTDDASDDDVASDGDTDIKRSVARHDALFLLDALLADVVDGDGAEVLAQPALWTEGLRAVDVRGAP